MDYTGRVTCDLSQQVLILQGLKDRCERIIVYRHEEAIERPHIHCLMYGVKCSYDTLVNVVKRAIPNATRDMYSFPKNKKADDDFISYMSKGKYDPILNVGFTDDLVKEKKSKGFDKKDVNRSSNNITMETTPQPKERKTQITQHMLVVEIASQMCLEAGLGPEDEPPYNFEDLYTCTVKVLKDNKKGGDIFSVMKTMESVLMMQYPSTHRCFVKQAWNSRHKISF